MLTVAKILFHRVTFIRTQFQEWDTGQGWGPIKLSELGALTREEGNVGMFGVIRATGHAADVVPEGLQCVHL